MAVKSIISVDIDPDGNFKKFTALYEKYQAALVSSPAIWAKVEKSIGKSHEAYHKMVAAATAANIQANLQVRAQAEADRLTRSTADHWRDMAKASGNFASNIWAATKSLSLWGGLAAGVAGLVGVGGLWGLDRLAGAAAGQRRSALGLGLSPGQAQAFGVNFGRLVEPDSFLSGVNESLHDISKRSALYNAGLTDLAGKNTAQVALELLPRLKALADQTPDALLAQVFQARGVGQFGLSLEDFQRLKNTSPDEFAGLQKGYASDARTFAQREKDLRLWQDFNTQLSRAEQGIESSLIRGLAPLAPDFAKLSESASKAISTFLSSDTLKHWIDEAGPALEKFATFIGSQEFQQDVKTFTTDVGILAQKTVDALQWLGLIPGPKAAPAGTDPNKWSAWSNDPNRPFRWYDPGSYSSNRGGLGAEQFNHAIRQMGWSPQAAAALQGNLAWESGGEPNKWGDNHTAYGLFQWHADRRADFAKWAGHSMVGSSAEDQLAFANYELTKGKERLAGDKLRAAKTIQDAAWIVDKYYERPKDPAGSYAQRATLAAKANKNVTAVTVHVDNNTGGNAVVSSSMLGVGP